MSEQANPECSHLSEIGDFPADSVVCPQCVEMGSRWVNLRQCLICGQVDVVIVPPIPTPPNISRRLVTPWSAPSNQEIAGFGVIWTRLSSPIIQPGKNDNS